MWDSSSVFKVTLVLNLFYPWSVLEIKVQQNGFFTVCFSRRYLEPMANFRLQLRCDEMRGEERTMSIVSLASFGRSRGAVPDKYM
jgi:hypothetical protein